MTGEHSSSESQTRRMVHVIQGGFETTADPDVVYTTILGSCVATCIFDPKAEVGGINHFLLPGGGSNSTDRMRYGLHSMELLINGLLKLGARKERMQAKVFGGASMHDGLGSIGQSNGEFAIRFLETENIVCVGHSLGGNQARRIRFWPTVGRAQQMFLDEPPPPPVPPKRRERPRPKAETDDVEFF